MLTPTGETLSVLWVIGSTAARVWYNFVMMNETPKRNILIVANWKMAPSELGSAKDLISKTKKKLKAVSTVQVVVCPPAVYLADVVRLAKGSPSVGAQDLSVAEEGEWTGEVGAKMYRSLGLGYSIVGHSERRKRGETDGETNLKLLNCLRHGLTPILCFGEDVRDDSGEYLDFLKRQLDARLATLVRAQIGKIILAYEPVWAIGAKSKREATVDDVFQMVIFLRKYFSDKFGKMAAFPRFLFGGSVNEDNAALYLSEKGVDGLLVGRASLDAERFGAILRAVSSIQ